MTVCAGKIRLVMVTRYMWHKPPMLRHSKVKLICYSHFNSLIRILQHRSSIHFMNTEKTEHIYRVFYFESTYIENFLNFHTSESTLSGLNCSSILNYMYSLGLQAAVPYKHECGSFEHDYEHHHIHCSILTIQYTPPHFNTARFAVAMRIEFHTIWNYQSRKSPKALSVGHGNWSKMQQLVNCQMWTIRFC